MANMAYRAAIAAAALLLLAGCGGGDGETAAPPTPPTTPSSQPPAPAGANFNVLSCLTQEVAPGRPIASLVVPDSLGIDLNVPPGFPNGRQLTDPVIDLTLAVLLLDLKQEPVTRFVDLPLNPPANDVPFRAAFPYLAAAQGNPPIGPVGSNFNFRTDPASAYVRVDRMGMPAVATALISSSTKNKYNDKDPIDDNNFLFYDDIFNTLTGLTNALSDDLSAAGFKMCAVPN
ncbi:hypothetical protein ASE00_04980 [Sphingomonas sp. Root710]|uniref:DUF4331 family protein n=1 Tax=Sphingomonas sp. Root710 TaxID=1736594 RepID=UPI0006F78E09|nr:DUF4331 family protein [Sphingomonas sp. Root710]KRB86096.1 hypothetical protein ASE00_04980 [Sphingomonas sp. Root710]